MDANRRFSEYLRSTADLADYLRTCRETGDLSLVEAALRDMPEWATFHEVRSAVGAAGLQLCVRPLSADANRSTPAVERRRGPRTH